MRSILVCMLAIVIIANPIANKAFEQDGALKEIITTLMQEGSSEQI